MHPVSCMVSYRLRLYPQLANGGSLATAAPRVGGYAVISAHVLGTRLMITATPAEDKSLGFTDSKRPNNLKEACNNMGHAVAQLVEALRYKPVGRGFNSRWRHWNFSLT